MTKFNKKPDEYEGKQWDGTIEGAAEIEEFLFGEPSLSGVSIKRVGDAPLLDIGIGHMRSSDWVLRNRNGVATVLSEDRLKETYWEIPA